MSCNALCIILNSLSNPLKGTLSYYNFFLKGEISKLIYNGTIPISQKEKVVLYKNDINQMFPDKIIFFIGFSDGEISRVILDTLKSLNISQACIVRGDDNG